MFTKYRGIIFMVAIMALFALVACSGDPQVVEVERIVEVEKEVPVEVEVERIVEVEKEVTVEVEVEKIVEVEKEVTVEVEVEKIVEVVEVMAPGRAESRRLFLVTLTGAAPKLQNRIAQYVVEKGYGYPTDLKFGATLPLCSRTEEGRHST